MPKEAAALGQLIRLCLKSSTPRSGLLIFVLIALLESKGSFGLNQTSNGPNRLVSRFRSCAGGNCAEPPMQSNARPCRTRLFLFDLGVRCAVGRGVPGQSKRPQ